MIIKGLNNMAMETKLKYWGKDTEVRKITWLHELACRYNRLRLIKAMKDSGIWQKVDEFWNECSRT